MAQGLGIATGTQELIAEQQQPGQDPPLQTQSAQTIPEQAQAAPPPVVPEQAVPGPGGEPPPVAPRDIVPAEAKQQSSIPDITTNPVAALGLVLRNISAGYRGQDLPTDVLRREERQSEMMAISSRMDKANHFMKIMDKGVDIAKQIKDPEARNEVIDKFVSNFPMFDSSLADNIKKIAEGGDAAVDLELLKENMPALHLMAKGDDEFFNNIIGNKELRESLLQSNARNKRGFLTKKIPEIIQFANANGLRMESIDDIFAVNDKLEDPLNDLELDALTRQSGIAARFGLQTQAQAEKGQAGKSRMMTLSKEQVAQLGLPEGSVVQQSDEGKISVAFTPSKGDQRDRKIQSLMAQDLDRATATNIIDGNVELEIVPSTGQARLTNRITNEVTEIEIGSDRELPTVSQPDKTLFELVDNATGAIPAAKEIIGDTAGQVFPGLVDEEMVEARQTIETATTTLIRALAINSRYPVGEINRLKEEVNIAPSILKSPAATKARMKSVHKSLTRRAEQDERDAANPKIPGKARAEAVKSAGHIRNYLSTLGVGKETNRLEKEPLTPEEQQELDELTKQFLGQ